MKNNYIRSKRLFDIWEKRNFDLVFYFKEIFKESLDSLSERILRNGIQLEGEEGPKYKSLFIPVGFSIENVSLMSVLFKPDYLILAFTELSKRFHSRHLNFILENIKKYHQFLKITEVTIISDDQKHMEQKILEWIDEMITGYGLSYTQMAIDLTGGTKPMSIGAYNAALSFDDIDAFYLKTDYDEDTKQPLPGTEELIPFKKEKTQVDKDLIFVIMPFKEEYNKIYSWIEEAVRASSLKCLRVDKEIFTGGIMDRVRENIVKARCIIADLTEANLNVYYELGLSHGYSKNVIMLAQDIDKLPFDLKHLRMVLYKQDNKTEFVKQLIEEIEYTKSIKC